MQISQRSLKFKRYSPNDISRLSFFQGVFLRLRRPRWPSINGAIGFNIAFYKTVIWARCKFFLEWTRADGNFQYSVGSTLNFWAACNCYESEFMEYAWPHAKSPHFDDLFFLRKIPDSDGDCCRIGISHLVRNTEHVVPMSPYIFYEIYSYLWTHLVCVCAVRCVPMSTNSIERHSVHRIVVSFADGVPGMGGALMCAYTNIENDKIVVRHVFDSDS